MGGGGLLEYVLYMRVCDTYWGNSESISFLYLENMLVNIKSIFGVYNASIRCLYPPMFKKCNV